MFGSAARASSPSTSSPSSSSSSSPLLKPRWSCAVLISLLSDMRLELATLVCFFIFACPSDCAPPTCYSRALGLSREVMALLDRIHASPRTKTCAEVLPVIFIDVHNSCITTKLRDFLYVVLNHPNQNCRQLPRMVLLKRKVQTLRTIINRVCYRDLVFFTDDCEAIDTGHIRPHYAEDRLQLLQEER